jgi:hypothetical protein
MAMLPRSFQTASVAPSQSRELLPPGKYNVQIVASEFKSTKSGTGQYLSLEVDILEGEHAGRKIWTSLNLQNPNPKAVEIAEETLRDICLAQGKLGCDDSEELHFIPMTATIKIKPGDDKYGPKNEIGGYKALEQAARPAPAQRPVASQYQRASAIPEAEAVETAPVSLVQRPAAQQVAAGAPASAPWRRQAS